MKQQVSKTCKPQGFEGSNPSLSASYKAPARVLFLLACGSGTNCFVPRRDLKGAAMFWFAQQGQGQNREPGLQENSVRNFTGRQIPPSPPVTKHPQGCFFIGLWERHKLLCAAHAKWGSLFIFTFWIMGEPPLFNPFFLFKQLQNAPPASKPCHAKRAG